MASTQLFFDILARDNASAVFNKVGAAADQLGRRTDRAGKAQTAASRSWQVARRALAGLATGYAAIKVAQFAKESVQASSDLQEQMSATSAVFGKSAKAMQAWADTSVEAFGQSRREALQYSNSFGTLANSIGLGQRKQVSFSQSLTELTADMASFKNTTIQEAAEALQAGLVGETEPLRRYGIFLNDAKLKAKAFEMGLSDGKAVLDEHSKAMAAYEIIMETARRTNMKGDFARTADNYANQVRKLQGNVENLKATLGSPLMGAANEAFKGFNETLPALEKMLGSKGADKFFRDIGRGMGDAARWVAQNRDQIKDVLSDVGEALGRFGRAASRVWETFSSLPPGMKETLATMAVAGAALNKIPGAGSIGKGLFSGLKTITAGNVTVVGKSVTGTPGGGKGTPLLANPLAIATIVTAAATVWNSQKHAQDNRNPVVSPAPGGGMPGWSGVNRGMTSQGNRNSDWIEFGKQNKAMSAWASRYAAQWGQIRVSIKDASGAYTFFAMQQKDKKWIDEKQPRAIQAAADRYKALARAAREVPDEKKVTVKETGAEQARTKVKGLGGAIGGLKGKTVKVEERGAEPSRGRVKNLQTGIGVLKGKTVKVDQNGAEQAKTAIDNLRTTINLLQSKTIDVVTRYRTEGGGPGKEAMVATGGKIRGPGTGTSDSIPAMLSNGEYVVRAAAVAHYGDDMFHRINAMRFAKGGKAQTDDAKKRAKEIAQGVQQARKQAAFQARQAKFVNSYYQTIGGDLGANWLGGLDPAVARKYMKPRRAKLIGRLARQSNAVGDVLNVRAQRQALDDWGASLRPGNISAQQAKQEALDGIAAAKKAQQSKNAAKRAKGYEDELTWQQRLLDANERLKAAEEERIAATEQAQDQALEQVNQLRDAVDGLSGSYRSFAGIASTQVTDVADAQSKLSDANTAVAEAQKRMDLAGNDRERAAAAADLAKALRDQHAAQVDVNTGGVPTSGGIRANMASKLQKLRNFSSAVKTLKDRGLNPVTLAEIMAMGPEQGYDFAQALLSGGTMAEINALQNEITAAAATLGYQQYGAQAGSDLLTGTAAANAAGLVTGGIVMAPAPVTVSIDGQAIAQALISYQRQNGGTIPGLTS